MKRKWRRKNYPRTSTGPTRGKYRQMWKRTLRDMIPGEEEVVLDECGSVSTSGAGEHRETLAA